MMKQTLLAVVPLLALAGSGCALTPPFRNGGPAVSHEGVQVAVTGQRCDEVEESEEFRNDLVETTLEVQVRNPTAAPLVVHRDAFRLVGPRGTALRSQAWGAADPMTIAAGASATFQLRFMGRGGVECGGEMLLDLDAGLALPGGPVKVASVRFVPSRV
jgi:hypothetical protein